MTQTQYPISKDSAAYTEVRYCAGYRLRLVHLCKQLIDNLFDVEIATYCKGFVTHSLSVVIRENLAGFSFNNVRLRFTGRR